MRLASFPGIFALVLLAASLPGGDARSQAPSPVEDALRAQLPTELPEEGSPGWPQPAITLAIAWHRLGEHELARQMAGEIWLARDQQTGLWVNDAGYVDGVNPFFATLMFALTGQPDRAVATSQNAINHVRENRIMGAYNELWFAALSARLVGNPVPIDLIDEAALGLHGIYAPSQGETAHGRYYSDLMRAYDCATGGPCRKLISDETDYCPTLGQGQRECESFYAWANGEPLFPDLQGEDFSFWTDGIVFYALPGLGLDFDPVPQPDRLIVPHIAGGGSPDVWSPLHGARDAPSGS